MRRLTLIFALVMAVTGIRAQGTRPDDERAGSFENCLSDQLPVADAR